MGTGLIASFSSNEWHNKPVTLLLSSVWWLTLWGFNSHPQDWNQSNWGHNGRLLTYFKLDTHSQQCCRRAPSLMALLAFCLLASSAITWRKLFSSSQPLAHAWTYWRGRSRREAAAAGSGRRGGYWEDGEGQPTGMGGNYNFIPSNLGRRKWLSTSITLHIILIVIRILWFFLDWRSCCFQRNAFECNGNDRITC